MDKLKDYQYYVGYLFRNQDGVFNVCNSLEEIEQTNRYRLYNLPLLSIVVSDEDIKIGDKFLAACENSSLRGNTYTYNGDSLKGVGIIEISDNKQKIIHTLDTILDGAYKVLRVSKKKDIERLLVGDITPIIDSKVIE